MIFNYSAPGLYPRWWLIDRRKGATVRIISDQCRAINRRAVIRKMAGLHRRHNRCRISSRSCFSGDKTCFSRPIYKIPRGPLWWKLGFYFDFVYRFAINFRCIMSDDVSMIDEGNCDNVMVRVLTEGKFRTARKSRIARLWREIDPPWERVNRKRMKFYLHLLSFHLMMEEILSTASSYNSVDAYSMHLEGNTFSRDYS